MEMNSTMENSEDATWQQLWAFMSSRSVLVASIACYLLLVRLLRYQRAAAIAKHHGLQTRASFATMTADQAQDVLRNMVEMEFPKLMGFSIVFALFKTYGIPGVSSLLVASGELSSTETASKRTADTGVLLLEFCLNKPSSDRSLEAIARMNYIHSHYIKSGKISNADMLYTLSVFALEPVRWVNRYEWRSFTDLELCATGTFWKAMGDKMEIDFSILPSAGSGWVDGLQWLEEIRVWSEDYEKEHMVPHELNHKLATSHLDVIFLNLPARFNLLGRYLVSAIVEPRLQKAMMLPEPPALLTFSITTLVKIRKVFLRHLCLPRSEFGRKSYISKTYEKDGRISAKEYLSYPWYVKPTWARRWGLRAWVTWALGRKLPGDDGNKYMPEGYLISAVGPKRFEKHGSQEMRGDLLRMKDLKPGGCPFAFVKK